MGGRLNEIRKNALSAKLLALHGVVGCSFGYKEVTVYLVEERQSVIDAVLKVVGTVKTYFVISGEFNAQRKA